MPDEIYINGIKQTEIKSKYYFNESKNEIRLIWETNINTDFCFFRAYPDISEINLTYLDISQIRDMQSMFNGCSSLISLDLSHFVISKVSNIITMFNGCSSLEYIDLENAII
jgi:surface protein